jgi:ABC-type dipeptide/oligopeptide/nickel transport system ATPase component
VTELFRVDHVTVDLPRADGRLARVLDDVSCHADRGEIVGVVGESGSGKTMLMRAILGLLPPGAQGTTAPPPHPPAAMVFQDPMTSLDPVRRIGYHLVEVVRRHASAHGHARDQAIAALARVGIDDPVRRFRQYPHELSGGMRQRVMIAMALLAEPELLLADEPTTALDVTIQAQILDLIADLRATEGLTVVLVTHDLGVIAGLADRVMVMSAGRVVEEGPVDDIFYAPRHPYTRALLAARPGAPRSRP